MCEFYVLYYIHVNTLIDYCQLLDYCVDVNALTFKKLLYFGETLESRCL